MNIKNLHNTIDVDIDLPKLKYEVLSLIDQVGWENSQIALQHTGNGSWHQDVDYYGSVRKEHECTTWNSELDDSYLKQVILSANINVASARIMLLPPITCYITHVDLYTRYHVPIVNELLKSFMVFNQQNQVLSMEPGKMYWTNTHEVHNYINGAYTNRINIIFNDACELPYLDNPFLPMLFPDFTKDVKWR